MVLPDSCLLGMENKTKIEDLEKRIVNLARGGTNAGNGALRYVGLVVGIALACAGSVKWVGRDVDVLRDRHREDVSRIEARAIVEIGQLDEKMKLEISKSDERSKARLEKLEEWQKWTSRTPLPLDTEQNRRLLELEKRAYDVKKEL